MRTRRVWTAWPPALTIAILSVAMAGCSPSNSRDNPRWVDQLISRYQEAPVGNPPQSIWRYEYKGQNVYYVPAQCCDKFSELYDAGGNMICAPDGGLTGKGDGKCPDFLSSRKNEALVWKDTRTR
jgi:hypothetical protein